MSEEHDKLVIPHSMAIQDHESRIKHLETANETWLELAKGFTSMAADVKVIANETVHQGKQLETMVATLQQHENEFSEIKEQMGTKESLKRVWDGMENINKRVSNELSALDKRITTEENKEAQAALQAINKIKWWFMGGIGAVILAVVMMYLGLK